MTELPYLFYPPITPQKETKEWSNIEELYPLWQPRSNLVIQECGAGGDCLFYVISRGFHLWKFPNEVQSLSLRQFTMKQARGWAASYITPDNVDSILELYSREWFTDHVWKTRVKQRYPYASWYTSDATWKPYLFGGTFEYKFANDNSVPAKFRGTVVTEHFKPTSEAERFLDPSRQDFKYFTTSIPPTLTTEQEKRKYSVAAFKTLVMQTIVKTCGEKFRGDDRTLEWISSSSLSPIYKNNMGFIVLNDLGTINSSLYPNDRFVDKYMLLFNSHNHHWQLVGVKDNNTSAVHSVFDRNNIPTIIQQTWVNNYILAPGDVKEMDSQHPMFLTAQKKFPVFS